MMSLGFLISLPAFSAANYSCVAGRYETINFMAQIDNSQIVTSVTSASTPDISNDLRGKNVKLTFQAERSSTTQGWLYYTGKIVVSDKYQEYRHVEMGISPKTPVGSTKLVGTVLLSPRGMESYATYLKSYDLNCSLVK